MICRQATLEMVRPGDRVCLAARNASELSRIASDLQIRRKPELVITRLFDTNDFGDHQRFIEEIHQTLGALDIILVGTGVLGDQIAARSSIPAIREILNSNFVGIATLLSSVANIMESQRSGIIAVLSSVAGDRGRQSNYIYGSAKSGMTAYLSGLRNRLSDSGVRVLTIKLGFVDTRMIAGMGGAFLRASPYYIGRRIVAKLDGESGNVYLPWFWRYIMLVIVHIPEGIFRRLKL
ncbi:SDR family NAD(P)-dependent oxidoreductase [Dyella ginsengisoli]|uniref:SDR family NAD(P)-dependent oxidoreductase n=2 Tax=Dyella ginsengisoli TaxID=363848 RepID=A0ABW8JVF5_9GAMM